VSYAQLYRLSGIALILAGVCTTLFWLMAAPLGTFFGVDVVQHPFWTPSQILHVVGALLTIFGVMGLYSAERALTGALGLVGFGLATAGAALFLTDGLIALVVFPALAAATPELFSRTGPLNDGPVLLLFVVIAATNLIGQVVLGFATLRSRLFPGPAALLIMIGGAVANLPVGPVLLVVLSAGGIVWGVGAVWLGVALSKIPAQVFAADERPITFVPQPSRRQDEPMAS